MEEIWKDIKGFEGLYQVSNYGNVRSLKYRSWDLRKPHPDKDGYPTIFLHINNTRYRRFIHRIVAESFIDNPNHLPCVNHIDGNKSNNHVTNLEWVTHKENTIHAVKTGLMKNFGQKPVKCVELDIDFESVVSASKFFKCDPTAIHRILHGRSKRLRHKYTFIYT